MDDNIKSVFDRHCTHLKINAELVRDLSDYKNAFINANPDHIAALGGNLIGVHPIRFKPADKARFLDELLDIDEYELRREIIALPTIDEAWIRSTDVMNLMCLYLAHRFATSGLPQTLKHQGMFDSLMILSLKSWASLMSWYFKFPADEQAALATYAALSRKFALKQLGSMLAVLEARCENIIAPNEIHTRTIERFDDDDAIVYAISDIQGRLRSMVKNWWREFDIVRTQNSKILTQGGMVTLEGKTVVRDVARNFTPFRQYMAEVSVERGRFIKPELIDIISSAMQTMPDRLLYASLGHLVDRAIARDKHVIELIDETLLHMFDYLHNDPQAQAKMDNIPELITKLRALYMSSRSTDPALLKMRELARNMAADATRSKNATVLASVGTGVILYLVLRCLTRSYYK